MCFEGKKDQWEVVIIAKNKVFQEHKVVEITKLKDTPWYEHNISKKIIIILLQWHLLTKSKRICLILWKKPVWKMQVLEKLLFTLIEQIL